MGTQLTSFKKELSTMKQTLADAEKQAESNTADQNSVMMAKIERLESQLAEKDQESNEMKEKSQALEKELDEAGKQVAEYKIMLSEIQIQLENSEVGGEEDESGLSEKVVEL